ncbi:MAG: hypothetical protein JJT88_11740 [Gammaproteobacteria bacterium]|nr:hypothetical protein [Gammaproteobacteria bacterium]
MAVIALNWELGADLGHIGRLLPIARRLRDAGHRPVLIMRDITRAEVLLGTEGIEYLQAPVWMAPAKGLPAELNFTETLFRFGYLDPDGLLSMCQAWRALWALISPDLLVFDQAPTAMLAARGLDLPGVSVGQSFATPPQVAPLPPFRFWSPATGEMPRLLETEQRVTRNANAVLKRLNGPQIRQVSELFDVDRVFICTHRELDVYSDRSREQHVGPIGSLDIGVEPQWREGEGRKLFGYLKPASSAFVKMLEAMAASGVRCLVFAPGIPERLRRQFGNDDLRISTLPFRMRAVLQECSAVICHGGGMAATALSHGRPVLLLPTQMEQTMTSVRIEQLGAGVYLPMDGNPGKLRGLLGKVIKDEQLTQRAVDFAARVADVDQQGAIDAVTGACMDLLEARAS